MPRRSVLEPVRAIGRTLPDVEETTTWGAPTLKVRGRMMACKAINKQAEPNTLAVCLPIPQREELIAADPATYYVKPHYEEYPGVLVRLSQIHADALRDLMRMGWEFARSQAKRKSSARRPKTSVARARTAAKRN